MCTLIISVDHLGREFKTRNNCFRVVSNLTNSKCGVIKTDNVQYVGDLRVLGREICVVYFPSRIQLSILFFRDLYNIIQCFRFIFCLNCIANISTRNISFKLNIDALEIIVFLATFEYVVDAQK